jgi:acetyltransferase-like isoleucine patch superfamily enzyme
MNHALLGAGAVVMPGVTMEEGSVGSSLSYIRKDLPAWTIWFGTPARFGRRRQRDEVLRTAAVLRHGAGRAAV